MRHLDLAAVSVGAAAYAADIAPEKLSAWISTRVIRLTNRDKSADNTGDRRLLTLRTAHAVAITSRLAELGLRHTFAGAIARRAVANSALYTPPAFLVQRGRDDVTVCTEAPPATGAAIVIDATDLICRFNERLAGFVPELRSAGIV